MMVSTFVSTHPGVVLYNVFQLVGITGVFSGEAENPMPYSKFAGKATASTSMIPSKIGMLIIYGPATIISLVYQTLLPLLWHNATATPAGWLVIAHFLKRDLEVMFLHKYSGHTELGTARMISAVYSLTSFMICAVAPHEPSALDTQLGIALFAVGSLGNLYHHYLLAQLRPSTNSSNTKYVAPKGGLFAFVAAPHYLFELIAWLGIAVCSEQLTAYLNLASMTCYLAARSRNQNNWNKAKFDEKEWPASRKNLVPFLY
jgi:3-oxo-5-alpha-steroid 4-dehydrogenase